jgi:nucleoside-diphosphate-sugar epimerase
MQSVIPRLVKNGHQVAGADNLCRYGERLGLTRAAYDFYKVDLSDRVLVEELFDKVRPDYVIQAAARIYGVGGFNRYCADILGEDLSLHNNVLISSFNHKVKKVVYISSSMVYENCPQDVNIPVTEEMPFNYPAPFTDYGLSKFTGERLSMAFWSQYRVPFTIWRPFNIITPFEKGELELGNSHVFADFINNIIARKDHTIPLLGDGQQIRCFTWIDEIADAIADFSFQDKTDNGIYNLGNAEPITMRELAKKIYICGKEEFGLSLSNEIEFATLPAYPNDVRVRIPDVSKAKNELGWEAKIKVDESIRRCLAEAVK